MGTNICLKEWSPVIEALGTGKQTLLIRALTPRYEEFLLYPTFSFYTQYGDKLEDKFQQNYVEMATKSGVTWRIKLQFLANYFAILGAAKKEALPSHFDEIWRDHWKAV